MLKVKVDSKQFSIRALIKIHHKKKFLVDCKGLMASCDECAKYSVACKMCWMCSKLYCDNAIQLLLVCMKKKQYFNNSHRNPILSVNLKYNYQ